MTLILGLKMALLGIGNNYMESTNRVLYPVHLYVRECYST